MTDITIFPARTIVTMDPSQPTVQAVAVRDGKVLAAGSIEECTSWGPHTIDDRFADHVLTPGMIEAHAHVFEGAFGLLPYAGWFPRHRPDGSTAPGIKTYDALLDLLRQLDQETRNSNEPIIVWGFDPIYFVDEDRLTRDHLDRASMERPIFVFHASAHLATINTAMLERHDITSDSATVGVARDAAGDPNGELQEMPAIALATSAIHTLMKMMGDPEAIRTLGQMCANVGITSLVDLGASGVTRPEGQAMWHEIVTDDFPARIHQRHLIGMMPGSTDWAAAANLVKNFELDDTDRLRTAGLKVVLDGSIQGFTAKMKWPGYYSPSGVAPADHGVWMVPPEQLIEMVRPFHERRINTHVHCNGDLTIDLWIDVVEQLLLESAWLDHRYTVQHSQLTSAAQFRRMAKLGMCANIFSNHIWYWGDQHHDITVGPERARRMEACKTAEDLGVPFSIHSDASVTPLGHLHTMWCAVNRVTPSGRVLGENERISPESALHSVTTNAAYQLHADDEFGSIECGKAADFTVLEDNPLTVDPLTIKDIGVWGTIVGGSAYEAAHPGV